MVVQPLKWLWQRQQRLRQPLHTTPTICTPPRIQQVELIRLLIIMTSLIVAELEAGTIPKLQVVPSAACPVMLSLQFQWPAIV